MSADIQGLAQVVHQVVSIFVMVGLVSFALLLVGALGKVGR